MTCFLPSPPGPLPLPSAGGSSPLSILHSWANRYWMYCFLSELAEELDVPTFRVADSSRHFLFLFTCGVEGGEINTSSEDHRSQLVCTAALMSFLYLVMDPRSISRTLVTWPAAR